MGALDQVKTLMVKEAKKKKAVKDKERERVASLPCEHPDAIPIRRIIYDYILQGYRKGAVKKRERGATEAELCRVFSGTPSVTVIWCVRALWDGGYIRQYGPGREDRYDRIWVKSDKKVE